MKRYLTLSVVAGSLALGAAENGRVGRSPKR